jgi:GxxExxY protein
MDLTRDEEIKRTDLSGELIGAAIEVHRELGPGLLEAAYEECLVQELMARDIPFTPQVEIPIVYKGDKLSQAFRLDLLIRNRLVVEIKAVDRLLPVHSAQVITYLRLGGYPIGLLINFNVTALRHGIKRVFSPVGTS